MNMNIYLFCYNEEIMLPHTIRYYRERFPDCEITILDNESTDRSVKIAQSHQCHIVSFSTDNQMNEYTQKDLRNQCFKNVEKGWVIVADMDEWLDVTKEDLDREMARGTTILKTIGFDMVADSTTTDLSDFQYENLNELVEGTLWDGGDKSICFYRPDIEIMNYYFGGHKCDPNGKVVYSEKTYFLRHMSFLGMEYIVKKYRLRFERSVVMRAHCLDGHYSDDEKVVCREYLQRKQARRNIYEYNQ